MIKKQICYMYLNQMKVRDCRIIPPRMFCSSDGSLTSNLIQISKKKKHARKYFLACYWECLQLLWEYKVLIFFRRNTKRDIELIKSYQKSFLDCNSWTLVLFIYAFYVWQISCVTFSPALCDVSNYFSD